MVTVSAVAQDYHIAEIVYVVLHTHTYMCVVCVCVLDERLVCVIFFFVLCKPWGRIMVVLRVCVCILCTCYMWTGQWYTTRLQPFVNAEVV